MQAGAMRGCDSCSALVYVEDVFCPTCGAGVEEAHTAAGKVRIPVRRHGVVPPPPAPEIFFERDDPPRRGGAIAGLLVSAAAVAATAAALFRFW